MNKLSDLLKIFAVVFISHFMVLIGDGVYWESWLRYAHSVSVNGNPSVYRIMAMESNAFSATLYSNIIAAVFQNPHIGFKLLGFGSIFISAIALYFLLGFIPIIPQQIKKWLIAFFIVFPSHVLVIDYAYSSYSMDTALFYVATLLAACTTSQTIACKPAAKVVLRISAISIFLFCFSTGSLLVFYLVAFVFMVVINTSLLQNFRIWQLSLGVKEVLKFIAHNLDFFLLPFIWFVVFNVLLAPTAQWVKDLQYNQPNLLYLFLIQAWWEYIYLGSMGHIKVVFNNSSISFWLIWVLLAYWVGYLKGKNNTPVMWLHFIYGGMLCVVLLILAILPYLAVGRSYSDSYGYLARYLLLYPLPMAIGFLALSSIFSKYLLPILFAVLIFTNLTLHFVYQATFIKYRSVQQNILVAKNNLEDFSIVRFIDQYPVDDRFPNDFGMSAPYEKTAYLRWALNKDKWPVVNNYKAGQVLQKESVLPPWTRSSPEYIELLHYHQLDVLGCYGELIITKSDYAQTLSPAGTVMRYWYYLFLYPEKMTSWLRTLSYVNLRQVEMVGAKHCSLRN